MALDRWVRLRAGGGGGEASASGSDDGSASVSFSASESVDFALPRGHKPYMVLAAGESFSCANCKHLVKAEGGEYHCDSEAYARYTGGTLLTESDGKTPLKNASEACSDWFEPTEKK